MVPKEYWDVRGGRRGRRETPRFPNYGYLCLALRRHTLAERLTNITDNRDRRVRDELSIVT